MSDESPDGPPPYFSQLDRSDERFLAQMQDMNIPEEQKRIFLSALFEIMRACVEFGFNIDAVDPVIRSLVFGFRKAETNEKNEKSSTEN